MPKQDCYEASAILIKSMPNNAYLCNGHVYSLKLKRMIKHAWVEWKNTVYDYSNDKHEKMDRDLYYAAGRIIESEVHFYIKEKAIKMLEGTGKCEFWTLEQRAKILG